MSDLLKGRVGFGSNSGADLVRPVRMDQSGALAVLDGQRGLYDSARAGNIYTFTAPVAGVTIPVSTATAMVYGLWNKSSNANLNILKTMLGYAHATEVVGTFLWAIKRGVGSVAATGAGISADTESATAIRASDLVAMVGTAGKPLVATTTIVAATTFLHAGFGFPATTGAAPTCLEQKFNGEFIVPPGCAIFLVATAAQTQAMVPSIVWEEVPIV